MTYLTSMTNLILHNKIYNHGNKKNNSSQRNREKTLCCERRKRKIYRYPVLRESTEQGFEEEAYEERQEKGALIKESNLQCKRLSL